ncbi:MAG: hypothetical protein INR66_01915 [Gordonia polyisoprenivorans]|nr:hypothetical protein [Gordonia polyisoprenivorans]
MAAKTNWQSGDQVTAASLNDLGTEVNTKANAQATADALAAKANSTDVATALDGKLAKPTGTPDGTKFVADDGTLKTPAGGAATPDADATIKGKVQLAGDLAGSAAAPTVANVPRLSFAAHDRLAQAFGRRMIEPVQLVFMGSSTTGGLNCTTPVRRYVTRFGAKIQRRLMDAGLGGMSTMLSDSCGP